MDSILKISRFQLALIIYCFELKFFVGVKLQVVRRQVVHFMFVSLPTSVKLLSLSGRSVSR